MTPDIRPITATAKFLDLLCAFGIKSAIPSDWPEDYEIDKFHHRVMGIWCRKLP